MKGAGFRGYIMKGAGFRGYASRVERAVLRLDGSRVENAASRGETSRGGDIARRDFGFDGGFCPLAHDLG